ncbi:MAG TPA: alpha/beta fold hydrolase [Anaerolineales bacterium]|nr:alpha/beta fold hydrolase [Anaerolineales bacterium]
MTHSPDTDERVPAVLICHGFAGNRVESHFIFVKVARRLANAGFFVLRFDFRGFGERRFYRDDNSKRGRRCARGSSVVAPST